MLTVIICNTVIITACALVAICAAGALYIMACDEMTREDMGVHIK